MSRYVLVSGDLVKTGGMDRANYALASHLVGRGHEVHLVAHRVGPGLSGATFHRVPKPLGSYLLGEPLLRRYGAREAMRRSRQGARVVVNGGNCVWGDVNWVHYVHAAWTPRPGAGPGRRLKAELAHRLALDAERLSLRRAAVVIANSERTRGLLLDRLGLDPALVRTVYYGIDPAEFRPTDPSGRAEARRRLGWPDGDDRPALAFVGALGDLRKGLDTLLAAWRLLREGPGWNARLVVVGGGSMLGRHREEARSLGGSVEFLGFRTDVPAVLNACDALVSPARYEAYGLNAHEALCAGLPALVSRSSGLAERYPPGLDDLLIDDPDDPAGLADRIRNWHDQRERYAPAVAAFSDRLRSNTWDDMARQFLDTIDGAP